MKSGSRLYRLRPNGEHQIQIATMEHEPQEPPADSKDSMLFPARIPTTLSIVRRCPSYPSIDSLLSLLFHHFGVTHQSPADRGPTETQSSSFRRPLEGRSDRSAPFFLHSRRVLHSPSQTACLPDHRRLRRTPWLSAILYVLCSPFRLINLLFSVSRVPLCDPSCEKEILVQLLLASISLHLKLLGSLLLELLHHLSLPSSGCVG